MFFGEYLFYSPIPVAALSKAWVCGRTLGGIVGLSPAEDIDVFGSVVCSEVEVFVGLITCAEESYQMRSVQWV